VRTLSVAEQQMVEIARALSMKSQLIVMDEPTSALTEYEVQQLLAMMRELKAQGLSIIFITHHIEEAFEVCDRVTVLRDGRLISTQNTADVRWTILSAYGGAVVERTFQRADRHTFGDVALRARPQPERECARSNVLVLRDIHFEVRQGEIWASPG
jgi:inositol transport system ATP-binding protein